MRDDERQPPATDGHEGATERRAAPARPRVRLRGWGGIAAMAALCA
ncbi:sugar-binding protein, partial [Streptomyces sp. NEAU-H3]|nr:sugar-binding protein [Streptomyces sp. NEAU-H3]